ncbi:STAS domain-containing protein [Alkalihalobacillus sp. LMS39]|uniref:STAS domain-containing protein n=1 Tax=Alkalihalobacillus sp. LMS39 TaxID=2924032 RepID=UPI001FB40E14|nr:STAS domain-containing protein [Alkalihalobacillus sp. LMS39]UOE92511.1 STAS domain-containing protein [Alkalihalobacillus sp. LMS39]
MEKATVTIEKTSNTDNYILVNITGQLVYDSVESIRQTFTSITEKADHYILSISEVTTIDSTGIGALVTFAKTFGENNSAIVCNNPKITKLLHIARLELLFPIVESVEEAKTAMTSK